MRIYTEFPKDYKLIYYKKFNIYNYVGESLSHNLDVIY
jgi:hypothetical protein